MAGVGQRWLPALALTLAAALAGPANAADQPLTAPVHDADITYRSYQGSQPFEERMRWLVAEHRMRLDPPVPDFYLIVDYAARQLIFVDVAGRRASIATAPGGADAPPGVGLPPGAAYVRRGEDRVADTPCTEWQTTDVAGQPTQACITADGLLLRTRTAGKVLIEAVSVHVAPQNSASFHIPDGYARIPGPKQ